eukprot:gene17315-23624_t
MDVMRKIFECVGHAVVDGYFVFDLNRKSRGLLKLMENLQKGGEDPTVVTVLPLSSRTSEWFTIDYDFDIFWGVVRLAPATRDVDRCVRTHENSHGSARLGKDARSVTFASFGRFPIPLINLRFHQTTVREAQPEAQPERSTIGVMEIIMDSLPRRNMCHGYVLSRIEPGVTVSYHQGRSHVSTVSLGTVVDGPASYIELPDMMQLTKHLSESRLRLRRRRKRCASFEIDMSSFFTPEECAKIARSLGSAAASTTTAAGGGPSLVPSPPWVSAAVAKRLDAEVPKGAPWKGWGELATYGDTSNGMHQHRDEFYEFDNDNKGNDDNNDENVMTLLVYLSQGGSMAHGAGETVFECGTRVAPMTGRAILFSVNALHHSEPVVGDWRKTIAAWDVKRCGAASRKKKTKIT